MRILDLSLHRRTSESRRVQLAVRPSTASDLEAILDYFLDAPPEASRAMGVDPARLPARETWRAAMAADAQRPDAERDRFFLTWLHEGEAIGHSSINKIIPGREAFIHLHLWKPQLRRSGLGTELFRLSVAYVFERFALERLFCEPYAENPGPNRLVVKLGFELVLRHRTVPGVINFEQDVNRYQLERRHFLQSP